MFFSLSLSSAADDDDDDDDKDEEDEESSGLGVEHLQQQFVERDAVLAVQPQENPHGSVRRLSQQREAHQQPARPVLLSAGRLVLLQGLVEPVLEPLHRVRTVHRVSI